MSVILLRTVAGVPQVNTNKEIRAQLGTCGREFSQVLHGNVLRAEEARRLVVDKPSRDILVVSVSNSASLCSRPISRNYRNNSHEP